jgi:tetratricopeptide (TPR) repeat protein
MKTEKEIREMAFIAFKAPKNFGYQEMYIEGYAQAQKDLREELKKQCLYDSGAIGEASFSYLKVMTTCVNLIEEHGLGVFLRGVHHRAYSDGKKDLLESASEGFEEWFGFNTQLSIEEALPVWQAAKLSNQKIIQEKDEKINDFYENNQKIIKSLERMEEKYDQAVKDLKWAIEGIKRLNSWWWDKSSNMESFRERAWQERLMKSVTATE